MTGLLVPAAHAGAQSTPLPVITSLSVTSGPTSGGTRLTVHGTNLLNAATIDFGSLHGTSLQHVSSTTARITSPSHSALNVRVLAYNSNEQRVHRTGLPTFDFVEPPLVLQTFPLSAARRVTIEGYRLGRTTRVTFDGRAATGLTVLSTQKVHVTAPTGTSGTSTVVVTTPYGRSPAVKTSGYRYAAVPVVTGVNPPFGSVQGHDSNGVAITGRNFYGVTRVTVGGVAVAPGDIAVESPTSLHLQPPAHSAGLTHVVVTTHYGQSHVSVAARYRYEPAPGMSWSPSEVTTIGRGKTRAVSCPADGACVLIDPSAVATSNGATWSAAHRLELGSATLTSLSCPSVAFCVAGDSQGRVFTRTNGLWGGARRIDGDALKVSCASSTSCLAVDSRQAYIEFNGTEWLKPQLSPLLHLATGISCATHGFCVAVDGDGDAYTFDGHAWSTAVADPSDDAELTDVSCAQAGRCVAVDENGNAVELSGGSWSAPRAVLADEGAESVSCPSVGFCIATSGRSQVANYVSGTWSAPTTVFDTDQLGGAISCSSAEWCTLATQLGDAVDWNGAQWSAAHPAVVVRAAFSDVSCPSAEFCMAVDAAGTATPWDGTSWGSPVPVAPDYYPYSSPTAVSCSSSEFCAMVTINGGAATYSDGVWSSVETVADGGGSLGFTGVDCVSDTFCLAVGQNGGAAVYNGVSWAPTASSDSSQVLPDVSCSSTTYCVEVSLSPTSSVFDGSTWHNLPSELPRTSGTDVSCPADGSCVAAAGGVYRLADQTWTQVPENGAGASAVSCTSISACVLVGDQYAATYDGSSLSVGQQIGTKAVDAVSCWAAKSCMAVGDDVAYRGTATS